MHLARVLAASALLLVADFPWRGFQDHSHWGRVAWMPFVSPPVRPVDIIFNLLLGVPLGLATVSAFPRRTVVVAGVALAVSLAGESTQLYSHSRFPSATDLVCNVAGAVAAALAVSASARTADSPHR